MKQFKQRTSCIHSLSPICLLFNSFSMQYKRNSINNATDHVVFIVIVVEIVIKPQNLFEFDMFISE